MSITSKLSIEEIALLAKQKMIQLGIENFVMKQRIIKIPASSTLEQLAYAEYWFLKEEIFGVTIESEYGFSGEQKTNYTELVRVHTGKLVIKNNTINDSLVEFYQVIPKRK